jgi:hypothetical protein
MYTEHTHVYVKPQWCVHLKYKRPSYQTSSFNQFCSMIWLNLYFSSTSTSHTGQSPRLRRLVNVKVSLYKLTASRWVQGGGGTQISRQSAHEAGSVSPKHQPSLPPGNIPVTHFCQRLSRPQDIVWPERLWQWKIPVTPSGIEPASFWIVALCLIQLLHRMPLTPCGINIFPTFRQSIQPVSSVWPN